MFLMMTNKEFYDLKPGDLLRVEHGRLSGSRVPFKLGDILTVQKVYVSLELLGFKEYTDIWHRSRFEIYKNKLCPDYLK